MFKSEKRNGAVFFGIFTALIRSIRILFFAICTVVVLFIANYVLDIYNKFVSISENQKKIEQLSLVVKNLSRVDVLARVKINDCTFTQNGKKMISFSVDILDLKGNVISTDIYELEGNEVWIDSVNLNFDYSVISSGKISNIAYPYRVYTDFIPAKDSFLISGALNQNGIPLFFLYAEEDILGLDADSYYARLKDLFDAFGDEKRSRELGIRSAQGNALHFKASKGDSYLVCIEGTGGLSLHKEAW